MINSKPYEGDKQPPTKGWWDRRRGRRRQGRRRWRRRQGRRRRANGAVRKSNTPAGSARETGRAKCVLCTMRVHKKDALAMTVRRSSSIERHLSCNRQTYRAQTADLLAQTTLYRERNCVLVFQLEGYRRQRGIHASRRRRQIAAPTVLQWMRTCPMWLKHCAVPSA